MIAYTADAWTQAIVAVSIFAPVVAAATITVWVLRGKKSDPDEQRWRAEAARRSDAREVAGRVDVDE